MWLMTSMNISSHNITTANYFRSSTINNIQSAPHNITPTTTNNNSTTPVNNTRSAFINIPASRLDDCTSVDNEWGNNYKWRINIHSWSSHFGTGLLKYVWIVTFNDLPPILGGVPTSTSTTAALPVEASTSTTTTARTLSPGVNGVNILPTSTSFPTTTRSPPPPTPTIPITDPIADPAIAQFRTGINPIIAVGATVGAIIFAMMVALVGAAVVKSKQRNDRAKGRLYTVGGYGYGGGSYGSMYNAGGGGSDSNLNLVGGTGLATAASSPTRPGLSRNDSHMSQSSQPRGPGGLVRSLTQMSGRSGRSGKSNRDGYRGVLVPGFTGAKKERGRKWSFNRGSEEQERGNERDMPPALVPVVAGPHRDGRGVSPARPGLPRNVSFTPSEDTVNVATEDRNPQLDYLGPSSIYAPRDNMGYGIVRTPKSEVRDPFADDQSEATLRDTRTLQARGGASEPHVMDTMTDRDELANAFGLAEPLVPVPARGTRRAESVKRYGTGAPAVSRPVVTLDTVESGDEGTLSWPGRPSEDTDGTLRYDSFRDDVIQHLTRSPPQGQSPLYPPSMSPATSSTATTPPRIPPPRGISLDNYTNAGVAAAEAETKQREREYEMAHHFRTGALKRGMSYNSNSNSVGRPEQGDGRARADSSPQRWQLENVPPLPNPNGNVRSWVPGEGQQQVGGTGGGSGGPDTVQRRTSAVREIFGNRRKY
ncbi:hypothetical protein HDV00_008229 [Rhizophlyctis rosea]|nr:hypothetical protein HDV00_008229 [Rhizophlyctis rosea]